MKSRYRKVVSIEIDRILHEKAWEQFRNDPNVVLVCGDCARELPKVLSRLSGRMVFWLDGYWSGAGTGRGEGADPVLLSLKQIVLHPVRDHAIFIDDARCFDGREEWPYIVDVLARLSAIHLSYRI